MSDRTDSDSGSNYTPIELLKRKKRKGGVGLGYTQLGSAKEVTASQARAQRKAAEKRIGKRIGKKFKDMSEESKKISLGID